MLNVALNLQRSGTIRHHDIIWTNAGLLPILSLSQTSKFQFNTTFRQWIEFENVAHIKAIILSRPQCVVIHNITERSVSLNLVYKRRFLTLEIFKLAYITGRDVLHIK